MSCAPLSRRRFLAATGLGLVAAPFASSIGPFQREGEPSLRLSVAAYSFRDSFRYNRGSSQEPEGRALDMFGFIDFCADHGVAGAELTSYFFPTEADADYFRRLRRHAFLRGISVSGTAVGNDFAREEGPELQREIESVKRWIDHADEMGAPHVRVFAGSEKEGLARSVAVKNCVAALEECCDYAGGKGIFLGLENHGGIVAEADQLLEVVRAVDSPWFGVNLDTGNFHTEHPYEDLAKCAPYAVNVQLKTEIGRSREERRPADLERLVRILRQANYQGYVAVEYEADGDPWQAVPETLEQLKELKR